MKEFKSPRKYQGGWVAIAIAAVGTVMSMVQGGRSAKEMRRAAALRRAQVRLQNRLARRDVLKQTGQAMGSMISAGASNAGVAGSGTEGALTSTQAQTTDMLKNTSEMNRLSMAAGQRDDAAAGFASKAQMWQAVGSIASSAAGSKAIDDVFGKMFAPKAG